MHKPYSDAVYEYDGVRHSGRVEQVGFAAFRGRTVVDELSGCVVFSPSLEAHGLNHHMGEHVNRHDRQIGKKRTLRDEDRVNGKSSGRLVVSESRGKPPFSFRFKDSNHFMILLELQRRHVVHWG